MIYLVSHMGTGHALGTLRAIDEADARRHLPGIALDYDYAPYDLMLTPLEEAVRQADAEGGVTHLAPGIFIVHGKKQ